MKEIFKDIAGYEGLYQVSNLGRVKSLNYGRTGKEKLLQPKLNNRNYWMIQLSKNGVSKKYLLHRLVAQTFLPNPNNLPVVNHIDENKNNNYASNLEWCTQQYNVTYNNGHRRNCKVVGSYKNGKLIKIYNALSDVEQFGYRIGHVWKCCQGKKPQYKGFQWKYLS